MSEERDIEISCIGVSFIEPILDLYKRLNSFKFSGYSKVRASQRENGYSTSIIILSILLIESLLNRVRYFEKDRRDNLKFFDKEFKNPKLLEKLYEVYVLRDLIVHNHLWRTSYIGKFERGNYDETKIYQKLLKSYGDKRGKRGNKKYVDHVDKRGKCTKKLKLNIIPTKVNSNDVVKVFGAMKEIFEFLEQQNKDYFSLLPHLFRYDDEWLNFYQIIDKIISNFRPRR
ncbi:MAG: hypothetical protein KAT49_00050 [Methanomicrobia archaeon]|nr:hypothetical protein [Methanomicrobia archaeon]